MINRIVSGIFVIVSIVMGIISTTFFSNGAMPYIRNITKVNLILGSAFIAVLTMSTIASYFMKNLRLKATLIAPGILLLLSSIGAIITSSMGLSTNIIPTTTPVIVLVGFIIFFATLMALTFVQFIMSLIYRTNGLI